MKHPYAVYEGNAVIHCMCEERICTFTKRIEVRGDQLFMIPGGYDATKCLRENNLYFIKLTDTEDSTNEETEKTTD